MPVADLEKIKRNVQRMIDGGASEEEIGTYLTQIKAASEAQPPETQPPALAPAVREGSEVPYLSYLNRRTLLKGARMGLETGGMMAGGLLALRAPSTGLVGPAVGYAAGSQAATALEEAAGEREPSTLKERAARLPKEILTGGALEVTGQAIGKGLAVFGEKVVAPFASRLSEAGKRLIALGKEYGVPLTAADILSSAPIAKLEQVLSLSPGSAGILQRFYQAQLDALTAKRADLIARSGPQEEIERVGLGIQEALEKYLAGRGTAKAASIEALREGAVAGSSLRPSLEPATITGGAIKAGVMTGSRAASEAADVAYDAVRAAVPTGTKITTPALEDMAQTLLKQHQALPSSLQDKAALAVIEDLAYGGIPKEARAAVEGSPALREAVKKTDLVGYTWDTVQGIRSRLNALIRAEDAALKAGEPGAKFLSTPEGGVYKQLKQALDQDIAGFAERSGGEIKATFDTANAQYAKAKQLYGSPAMLRLLKTNPEDVLDVVIRRGDVTPIAQVKAAAGEEGFTALKDAFTARLLQAKAETFSPKTLSTLLARYGDETLGALYTPEEVTVLKALASGGMRLEQAAVGTPLMRTIMRSSPEKVVETLIKPNNTTQITQMRRVLSDEEMQSVKTAFLERLFKRNMQTGQYSPQQAVTAMNRYGEATLKVLFNKPGELQAIQDQMALAAGVRGAERLAANPSGTGQALVSAGVFGTIMRHPVSGMPLLFLPNALAKIYLSDVGRTLLTTGYHLPAGTAQAAKVATQLVAIAGMDGVEEYRPPQAPQRLFNRNAPQGVGR